MNCCVTELPTLVRKSIRLVVPVGVVTLQTARDWFELSRRVLRGLGASLRRGLCIGAGLLVGRWR